MDKVRKGYKMTEIGEIPEDWEVKSIKEVADVVSGGTPSKNVNEYWEGGHIAWATPTDITKNRSKYIKETELYITEFGLKNSSANLLPVGSILMCSRATIGPRCINTVPMATNQGFKSFVCKDNLFNEFMYYLLEIVKDEFISLASGSTFLEISKREVENKLIPVPPLNEQKKIAEILSKVDESIEKTDEIIEKTKELKKGLMQKLLTKGIGHSKFKMTEIGEIPEEWEIKKISDVCEVKRGASPRPIDSPIWFSANSNIGWIRISDVTSTHKYLNRTSQYLSEEGIKKSRLVRKGNLIMSICATIGKPIIMNMDACIHDGFVVFDKLDKNIDVEYMYYFLSRQEEKFNSSGQTGTQKNLNTTIVGNTYIILPPQQEQCQIASILSAVDEKIEAEEKRKEQLLQLKKGLMQQLLTGRVRVK